MKDFVWGLWAGSSRPHLTFRSFSFGMMLLQEIEVIAFVLTYFFLLLTYQNPPFADKQSVDSTARMPLKRGDKTRVEEVESTIFCFLNPLLGVHLVSSISSFVLFLVALSCVAQVLQI